MAKKSSAELKAEGADLSALIATARRRPLNFAMLVGKEGIVLEAHPTKGSDVMRRQAKANGGGAKGAQGVMTVSGKLIELTCETDDAPRNLGKLAKRHFKERGIAFKVVLILPGGERVVDEEDEDDEEADDGAEAPEAAAEEATPDPRAAELAERHRKLTEDLAAAMGDANALAALTRTLADAETALTAEDFDTAQTLLDEAAAGLNRLKAAPPPVDIEALRATLQAEFAALADDLAFVKDKGSKGVTGKATQLAAMFEREVAGTDMKKAGAVLSLLRNFLKVEKAKIDQAVADALIDRLDEAMEEGAAAPADGGGGTARLHPDWPLPGTEDLPLLRPDPSIPAGEDPAVLNVISFIGAMEAPKGYDQVYGNSVIETPKPLTEMTVDEVLAWQRESVNAGSKSSASGQYQIIRKTLESLKASLELDGSEKFDKTMQDRMGVALMEGRGLDDWRNGKITDEEFCLNLSKEWAAIPVPSGPNKGKSFYDGDGLNSALTDPDMMLGVLSGKSPHGRPEAEAEPEAPEAPAEEAPAEESQSWGDWAREQASDLGEAVSETVTDLRDAAVETMEDLRDGAAEIYESAEDFVEDNVLRAELMAAGYPADLRELLVERVETDPAAAETAAAKLAELQALNLPDAQQFMLVSLFFTDPAAYAAATAALTSLDPTNSVDLSPEAAAQAEAALRAADAQLTERMATLDAADQAVIAAQDAIDAFTAERDTLTGGVAAASETLRQFEAGLGDPTTMTPEDLAAANAERDRLVAELQAATDALAAKQAQLDAAVSDEATKMAEWRAAAAEANTSRDAYWAAHEEQKAQDDKRGLLDALSFGALSSGAVPAFDDAQKASLIETYATSPQLGRSAMEIAANAEDPAMVVRNLPMITAKFSDGFADPSGQAVQRNGADLTEEERASMAANALTMGARQGEAYFAGFEAYLNSGAQHDPDPSGGMDDPVEPWEDELIRRQQVATSRSAVMAGSAIGADGQVNFDSPQAKAAMDQTLYHPGSLMVFTPMLTENIKEMQGLFADPANGPLAQGIITGTTLPPDDTDPDRNRVVAGALVGGTLGKDPAALDDNDARTAVLAAMMSPLSQGSVGSCFATAPTRKVRETNPLEAMQAFSNLASDGMFEASNGDRFDANISAPPGDNPLMRSWEYSAADAAVEQKDSYDSKNLTNGLTDLDGLEAIVGTAAWDGGGTDANGVVIEGIESKLLRAIQTDLMYHYVSDTPPPTSGAGDGSSDLGYFELRHGATVIDDEAKFYAAVKAIALQVCGETATSPKGVQIVALIDAPAFRATVAGAVGGSVAGGDPYTPWEIGGGGFGAEVERALHGGTPSDERPPMLGNGARAPTDPGDRARALLDGLLGTTPAEMTTVSTGGDNANHVFNLLPNDPSLDLIRDPDSAAKIQANLLDPGAAIASSEMPLGKVQSLYQAQIRQLSSWAWEHPAEQALLTQALARVPTTAMTPGALATLIDTETAAFRDAVTTRRADEWKAAEIAEGRTVDAAAYDARKAEIAEEEEDSVSQATAGTLADAFPLPEVVIADTNWGDGGSHTLFVIAPDPRTGELQLWKKDVVTGRLSIADDYQDANWRRMID